VRLADPLGRVYAEALFGIATERGVVDDVGAELEEFQKLSRGQPQIGEFLATPVVDPDLKVAVLRKAVEGRVSPLVADFLCLVVEKRRFAAFPRIVDAYRGLADGHAGRVRATLRTAAPVAAALRDEIAAALTRRTGSKIAMDAEVDPALLGGAVVLVDDRIYDGSLRSRLLRFRKQLIRSERP
jgi:F-type H+-transporting ATPase subunit delta